MKRGEIWLVGLDPTQGHEQKGRCPVLIVSPEAFNRVTKVPVVLPITSGGNFARTAGFAVPLADAGTKTTGIVRCDQPAPSISARATARGWKVFPTRSWTRCWRR
jgi:mRNA-degrading endonuclease toxin of MazEF toxin-antitoxin module